jgi:hypothetical protein
MRSGTAVIGLLGLVASAQGQAFVNGDFATGDFTGWTIVPTANGVTRVQEVVQIPLVGPAAPLVNAATFSVGQAVSSSLQEGIEMTQPMTLQASTTYDFGFNWAALRSSTTSNGEGGVFSLIVDGVALVTQNAGTTSSTAPHYGRIDGQFTPAATGTYQVGVRITRPFTVSIGGSVSLTLRQHVGEFTPRATSGGCYPNCDSSTVAPILNVGDFTCFLQRFAAGDSYANCDASTIAPVLNVGDFTCFLQRFAAGCP